MYPTAIIIICLTAVMLILALLSNFGMAKWFSVLFSDARNKLGDQVVFSNWKGRPYMRAYAIPANPNTLKQQAQRSKSKQMVAAYQANVKIEGDRIALWNTLALPRQISGFNLFGKYGLKIDTTSQAGGAAPYNNVVTYTVPIDLADMGLYRSKDGAEPTEIVAQGGLSAGIDQTENDDALAVGVYDYFIGPGKAFDDPGVGHRFNVACAHWKNNDATGVSDPATCTVT